MALLRSVFRANRGAAGGGAAMLAGSIASAVDCVFDSNDSYEGEGGALLCQSSLSLKLAGCAFSANARPGPAIPNPQPLNSLPPSRLLAAPPARPPARSDPPLLEPSPKPLTLNP